MVVNNRGKWGIENIIYQANHICDFACQFKQKKAREKYGDQDEDERHLMMEFLAVRINFLVPTV